MVRLPVFGIFNINTHVNARGCTRGLYGHRKRVCTGSWLWEKQPVSHRRLEPVSVLHLGFPVARSANWALPASLAMLTSTLTGCPCSGCFVLINKVVWFLALFLATRPCGKWNSAGEMFFMCRRIGEYISLEPFYFVNLSHQQLFAHSLWKVTHTLSYLWKTL